MLVKSKVVAFVASANPEKARVFYRETLELKEIEQTPYAIVFIANDIKIRVQIVETVTPPPYTVLGWEVENIKETVQYLAVKGVNFERIDTLPQDEHGIWTTPDNARVAWFQDPDGNRLSLTQVP